MLSIAVPTDAELNFSMDIEFNILFKVSHFATQLDRFSYNSHTAKGASFQ